MDVAAGRNISFPRYAEYNCAFRYIVEQALGARFVMPPALTKRTMDLGTKYSPGGLSKAAVTAWIVCRW